MNDNKDRFEQDARRILNQSLEELDGATLSRLNQARQRALAIRSRHTSRLLLWGSLPAGALAILLALLFWPAVPVPQINEPDLGDLHILTATEPLDFYQDDMEFYEWLSETLETENKLSAADRGRTVAAADGFTGPAEFTRPGHAGSGTDRVSRHI